MYVPHLLNFTTFTVYCSLLEEMQIVNDWGWIKKNKAKGKYILNVAIKHQIMVIMQVNLGRLGAPLSFLVHLFWTVSTSTVQAAICIDVPAACLLYGALSEKKFQEKSVG